MKFKTLKDLDKVYQSGDDATYDADLKQEAIKDIKELRNGVLKFSYCIQCAGEKPLNSNVVDYIKWKNNITEEDLK